MAVDKLRAESVGVLDRKKIEKKMASDEKELQRLQQIMQASRMKSGIFLTITFIVIYNLASSL